MLWAVGIKAALPRPLCIGPEFIEISALPILDKRPCGGLPDCSEPISIRQKEMGRSERGGLEVQSRQKLAKG